MKQSGKREKGERHEIQELQELEDPNQEKGKDDSQEDGDKYVSGMENNESIFNRSEASRSDIFKKMKLINLN